MIALIYCYTVTKLLFHLQISRLAQHIKSMSPLTLKNHIVIASSFFILKIFNKKTQKENLYHVSILCNVSKPNTLNFHVHFQDLRRGNKTSLYTHRFQIIIEEGYTSPFSPRPLNRLVHFFTVNRKTKITTATVIKNPKHVKGSTDSLRSTNITVTSCQARGILQIHSQGEKPTYSSSQQKSRKQPVRLQTETRPAAVVLPGKRSVSVLRRLRSRHLFG